MAGKNIKHTRDRLVELVETFVGRNVRWTGESPDTDCSDMALIVMILEELCEKVDDLDGHTHSIY